MNYTDTGNQQAMLDIGAEFDSCCSEYVVSSTSSYYQSWFQSFHSWLPTSSASSFLDSNGFLSNETKFNEYVQIFLSTPEGQFYAQDIKFDSNGRVVQSRITHAFPSVRQGSSVITSLCITHYVTDTDTLTKRRRRQSERGTTNEGSANGM